MEPSIPWPPGPEGYTSKEKKFVRAYDEESVRADRNGRRAWFLVLGLFISLILLAVSTAFCQYQTLIIDRLDLDHPVVLEVYRDQSDSNHYYLFNPKGKLTEIWINPFPSISIPKPKDFQSPKLLLLDKDFPLEKRNWWESSLPQEGNWWEIPDTSNFEYLFKNNQ